MMPLDALWMRCLCDWLSAFAILTQLSANGNMPSMTLIVGCGVSSLTLLTLVIIYMSVWWYIRSKRYVILINFCLSIISSIALILLIGQTQISYKGFLFLAWELPAQVVAISVGFTKAKGYSTLNYCWLSLGGGLLYVFVGPAAAVVLSATPPSGVPSHVPSAESSLLPEATSNAMTYLPVELLRGATAGADLDVRCAHCPSFICNSQNLETT
ncbi:hypothetical protein STEG23_028151 [Scotinomys teguina]